MENPSTLWCCGTPPNLNCSSAIGMKCGPAHGGANSCGCYTLTGSGMSGVQPTASSEGYNMTTTTTKTISVTSTVTSYTETIETTIFTSSPSTQFAKNTVSQQTGSATISSQGSSCTASVSTVTSCPTPITNLHRPDRMSMGIGIGFVAGSIGMAALACLIWLLLKRRNQRRAPSAIPPSFFEKQHDYASSSESMHRSDSQLKYHPDSLYVASMRNEPSYGYTKFDEEDHSEGGHPIAL